MELELAELDRQPGGLINEHTNREREQIRNSVLARAGRKLANVARCARPDSI